MTLSLSALTVLVTRPKDQGEELVELIRQHGGEAVHCPVMAITGLDEHEDNVCKQLIMDLDQFQHVIFVSTNAVRYGVEWIQQYWPQLPVGIEWYGIGKATQQALLALDIPVNGAVTEAMNSEALLEHDSLQAVVSDKVLIVRGVGGRDYLQEQLTLRGAEVSYAECYRRQPEQQLSERLAEIFLNHAINRVCCNSVETVDYFLSALSESDKKMIRNLPMVVPSQRVAQFARENKIAELVAAKNASDQEVLAALANSVQN